MIYTLSLAVALLVSLVCGDAPVTRPRTLLGPSFVVSGYVRDAADKPMQGVTMTANCGAGTLIRTGQTISAADGSYRLMFAPGIQFFRNDKSTVGMQAATIFASKPGFFEKNLCRQGNLGMTDLDNPDEDNWARSFVGIVRAGEENRGLNFVLLPAARLEGRLVDPAGAPIADKHIALDCHDDSLPPSSSVLDSTKTDADGRFVLDSVPTSLECWFSVSEFPRIRQDIEAEPFTFDRPDTYRFQVVLDATPDDPSLRVERR
jgi:hypothetical protein